MVMKFFTNIVFLIILSSSLFANIGSITSLQGQVHVLRNNKALRAFKSFKLEKQDIIETSKNGSAKMVFKDKTTITLGKNTIFKIEDYLFDNTKKSKSVFKITSGFFKAISGKIGKVARKNFKLKTINATIGIRGTIFEGTTNEDYDYIKCDRDSIEVSANGASKIVYAGEYTFVREGEAPLKPKKVKKALQPEAQQSTQPEVSTAFVNNIIDKSSRHFWLC